MNNANKVQEVKHKRKICKQSICKRTDNHFDRICWFYAGARQAGTQPD